MHKAIPLQGSLFARLGMDLFGVVRLWLLLPLLLALLLLFLLLFLLPVCARSSVAAFG